MSDSDINRPENDDPTPDNSGSPDAEHQPGSGGSPNAEPSAPAEATPGVAEAAETARKARRLADDLIGDLDLDGSDEAEETEEAGTDTQEADSAEAEAADDATDEAACDDGGDSSPVSIATEAEAESEAAQSTDAELDETEQAEILPPLPLPDGLTLDNVVESLIMVATGPLSRQRIAKVLEPEGVKPAAVREAVERLNAQFAETGRMFRIEEIGGGYQMYTLPAAAELVSRLSSSGPQEARLTQASLETLAIIAYKQPIIRADIEAIRGVACGPVLRHLTEVGLARIVGKSEQLGRPMLYGTTKKFLQHFGLNGLSDLPKTGKLVLPSERQEATTEASEPAADDGPQLL